MSRGARPIVILLGLLALSLLGQRLEHGWRRPPLPRAPDTLITIESGWDSGRIAAALGEAGVLESPRRFLWGLRLRGAADDLKAGRYRFPRPAAPGLVLARLKRGETERLWLTLPEGLWLDEAVGLIARELGLDSLDLAERVRRPQDFSHAFLAGRENLEGFLYPDTYAFEYPPQPDRVLRALLGRCERVLADLSHRRPAGWKLTAVEWVTLASLVEAEARLDAERGRIAAVYLNRLRKGMRLEADPTVMYALGVRKRRLYYKHLAVDSPYNTYLHRGLPPGPICSPGYRSLEGPLVADPGDASLYFVADGKGGHLFSESFAEHQRKVKELRRR